MKVRYFALLIAAVVASMFGATAMAQTPTSCQFEKPLEQSWADAVAIAKAEPKAILGRESQRDYIAVAVIAWGEKGMLGYNNPGGIEPNKTNTILHDAMSCYVMELFCDMPRKGQAFKNFKELWASGQWNADSSIPQYAPHKMVKWAETQLDCEPGMKPIRFDAPVSKPSVAKSSDTSSIPAMTTESGSLKVGMDSPYGDGKIVAMTRNPDGTGTITTRREVATNPAGMDTALLCTEKQDVSACRTEYHKSKNKYETAKSDKWKETHATFAQYWASKGCYAGGKDMCDVDRLFYTPEKALAESTGDATQWHEGGEYPVIPNSAARYMYAHSVSAYRKGARSMGAYDAATSCNEYYASTEGKYCFMAAWLYEFQRPETDHNLRNARGYYASACKRGSTEGCRRYGLMAYEGKGGDVDLYMASDYAAGLCKSGNAVACDNYHLGVLQASEPVSPQRSKSAAEYYYHHCNKTPRSYEACYNLGHLMYMPKFHYEQQAKALQLYGMACNSGGISAACKDQQALQNSIAYAERQRARAWERQKESRGLGGFLSDLGRGINQATSGSGAISNSYQPSRPVPQIVARSTTVTAQDWRNFNNAVRATNNIGTGYNSNCPASNPYC